MHYIHPPRRLEQRGRPHVPVYTRRPSCLSYPRSHFVHLRGRHPTAIQLQLPHQLVKSYLSRVESKLTF